MQTINDGGRSKYRSVGISQLDTIICVKDKGGNIVKKEDRGVQRGGISMEQDRSYRRDD